MYFRDRFRTTVNVLGDSFGTRIVERLTSKQLASQVTGHDEVIDDAGDTTLHSFSSVVHASNASKDANNDVDVEEITEVHKTGAST